MCPLVDERKRDLSTTSAVGDYFGRGVPVADGNLTKSVIAAANETKKPAILAGSSSILAPDGKKPSTMPRRNPTAEPPTRSRSLSVSRSPVKAKKNPKRKTPEEEAEPNNQWSKLMRLPRRFEEPSVTRCLHHDCPKCRH
jgi:hypothetical protein